MNRLVIAAVAAILCAVGAQAQEFIVTKPQREVPVVPAPAPMNPRIEGIVADIFNVKKPWQLVNPLAPKEYGDGRKNVTYSEKDPGKPKGFIVFALEW